MGRSFAARPAITQPSDPRIRHIPLTRGLVAIVDAEDYERIAQFKWTLQPSRNTFYATRRENEDGQVKTYLMHREVLGTPKGSQIDHANRNGLDNRKENLRQCTNRQNMYNRRRNLNNSSGFKGVVRQGNKFRAQICAQGERISIAVFDTPQEASAAYLGAATVIAGKFARVE